MKGDRSILVTLTLALLVVVALVLLADGLLAQQPNSPEASFTVGGFDDGNYPLTPLIASPGTWDFTFEGAPGQPFTIFQGPVSAGFYVPGSMGIVDLDFGAPSFRVLLDGTNPAGPLHTLAVLDATGQRNFPITFPSGFYGSYDGIQALVTDPTSFQGVRLTAANHMTIIQAFELTLVTPDSGAPQGGETVNIVGTGFDPSQPVTVSFGNFQAPYAMVINPNVITVTTPANFPGAQVDIVVTHQGLVQTLPDAFTYTPMPHPPVLINEINTGAPDYVELYNPNPVPVDISGWRLHSWYHGTTPDAGSPFVFAYGTFIPPFGFLVIEEYGVAHQPGTLPSSISCGYNFWWTGSRQVEVALVDNFGIGVDYVHRRWTGQEEAPNIPFPLSWTGSITTTEDYILRSSSIDTDDAGDFILSLTGSPGFPNAGQ